MRLFTLLETSWQDIDQVFERERQELLDKLVTWLTPLFGQVDVAVLKRTVDSFWSSSNDPLKAAVERLQSIDVQKFSQLINDRCDLLVKLGDRACPTRAGFMSLFHKDPVADAAAMLKYAVEDQENIRNRANMQRESERQQAEKNRLALHTKEATYERVDYGGYRIVCSDEDPRFEKTGMPMFDGDHAEMDKELEGYMAVHVTSDPDGWLPILMRDGYCDAQYAYVYRLALEEMYNSRAPFYEIEDYHIMDKTNTPDSQIVISKRKKIPARYIRLVERIDTSEIEEAPDPY